MALANVTSVRAHLDAVLASEADLLLLPETCLKATGQCACSPKHARRGGRPCGGAARVTGRGISPPPPPKEGWVSSFAKDSP